MDDRTRAGRARGHPSPGVNAGHSGDNPDAGLERLNRLPADASRMSMRSTQSRVGGGKLAGAFGVEDNLARMRQLGLKE
jgi:hypothetical protein